MMVRGGGRRSRRGRRLPTASSAAATAAALEAASAGCLPSEPSPPTATTIVDDDVNGEGKRRTNNEQDGDAAESASAPGGALPEASSIAPMASATLAASPVAAAAATAAPVPTRTQQHYFYGVRRGKHGLRGCVFLDWDSCRPHVTDDEGAGDGAVVEGGDGGAVVEKYEYERFATLDGAVRYASASLVASSSFWSATATPTAGAEAAAAVAVAVAPTAVDAEEAAVATAAALALTGATSTTTTTTVAATTTVGVKRKRKRATLEVEETDVGTSTAAAATKTTTPQETTTPQRTTKKRRRPTTTKKWDEMFERLRKHMRDEERRRLRRRGKKLPRATAGSSSSTAAAMTAALSEPDDKDLRRWIREQRNQYALLLERGGEETGDDNDDAAAAAAAEGGTPASPSSSRARTTPTSRMNPDKIRKLRSINFDFAIPHRSDAILANAQRRRRKSNQNRPPTVHWWTMLERLRLHVLTHGTAEDIRKDEDEELLNWARNQRYAYKARREADDKGDDDDGGGGSGGAAPISDEKIRLLEELGFDFKYKTSDERERDWDDMLEQLRSYREEYGDCAVPLQPRTELAKWVVKQRLAYKALQQGKTSSLTADKLQRLNDVGFLFCARPTHYVPWDVRIDQCRNFIEVNGHLRIPTEHPILGKWTNTIRRHYQLRNEGKPNSLSDERFRQLDEMGFVWLAGKRPLLLRPKMSWEERYQELLEYRDLYGHMNVPQSHPGLGAFVKEQRKEYKRMKRGLKSRMNSERAMRLLDVGFVFHLRERQRAESVALQEEEEEEEY